MIWARFLQVPLRSLNKHQCFNQYISFPTFLWGLWSMIRPFAGKLGSSEGSFMFLRTIFWWIPSDIDTVWSNLNHMNDDRFNLHLEDFGASVVEVRWCRDAVSLPVFCSVVFGVQWDGFGTLTESKSDKIWVLLSSWDSCGSSCCPICSICMVYIYRYCCDFLG